MVAHAGPGGGRRPLWALRSLRLAGSAEAKHLGRWDSRSSVTNLMPLSKDLTKWTKEEMGLCEGHGEQHCDSPQSCERCHSWGWDVGTAGCRKPVCSPSCSSRRRQTELPRGSREDEGEPPRWLAVRWESQPINRKRNGQVQKAPDQIKEKSQSLRVTSLAPPVTPHTTQALFYSLEISSLPKNAIPFSVYTAQLLR